MQNKSAPDYGSKTNPNWTEKLSIHWPSVVWLSISPLLALGATVTYVYYFGFSWLELNLLVSFYIISGLGITAGYHRYYSHRTHKAHPILEGIYLILGAMVMQRSVLYWARNHRIHHRHADTELDPHNIREGFFHAHMGWIFYNRPLDNDFSTTPDLLSDRLVVLQDRYYWVLFGIFGVAFPTFVGWCFGSALAGFVFGALLRIVLQNQAIFAINSVAHTFGRQTFSLEQEARDSWLLALVSNGEGFHSFHHRFASDYRNGWLWYYWDPSKWFILLAESVGLASDLKRAPEAAILKALMTTQRQLAKQNLEKLPQDHKALFEERLAEAQLRFETMLNRWQETKAWIREYKESRKQAALASSKAEYARMRATLKEYRREFELAREEWADTLAALRFQVQTLQ